ncbi:septal ring lytic transglycosylase RlpA family protein [Tardiphaga alba]|uniref:Endolytic peptidoglycan transglycosylase RlpA n=1 Tax=Tardiphaga alba TaxID=340268 RepID=A0ABX8A2Y0_9BRAD|nr:septal ring lytic transglycosylase RlpA family protein [Tardiphaga alba]QUS37521.1 septal ring lytic transglycosylase RlpA family protein [Tardiphaga alba]
MLRYGKSALGLFTQPRMAVALIAASVALGGTVSEASAKSKHRHHHKHHHHHAAKKAAATNPFEANASIGPASIGPFMPEAAAPVRTGGRSFSGVASFYGNEAGNKTASGQRFNQNAMTAAHRSLPFGTKLRVTHGGRSVVVTVNDRGPFIKGRVLDLSKGAASAIGLTSRGVGKVVAEVM